MTKQRAWPNNAAWIRDTAAEKAVEGIRALRPLIDGDTFTREETLRRQVKGYVALQDVLSLLSSVGAKVNHD